MTRKLARHGCAFGKALGKQSEPMLNAKAAEARDLVEFTVCALKDARTKPAVKTKLKKGRLLCRAGARLQHIYDIMASGVRDLSAEDQNRFLLTNCRFH